MREGTIGVQAPSTASALPHRPATGAVPPSASPDVDAARIQDPDNNAKNEAGAAAGDQDEQPSQEAHGAGGTVTQLEEEKPTPGTDASWPATPRGTRPPPQRDVAPAPRTGDLNARAAAETEPDVEAVKPGSGCTTPPPAHDSEASDDGRGSPLHEEKPGASVAAASRSRLLAFRSFSRDKKASNSDTAEHKEKGKERRKRFWK